ncbi:hypothetical protein ACVIHF_000715 [Bradyrhizobium sp. USDA 4506]
MSKFLNVLMGGVPIDRLEQMGSGVLVRVCRPLARGGKSERTADAIQFVIDEWMAASAVSAGELQWIDDAEVGSRLKRLREERTWMGAAAIGGTQSR